MDTVTVSWIGTATTSWLCAPAVGGTSINRAIAESVPGTLIFS